MALLKTYITDFINANIMPLGVTVIGIALIMVGFALIIGTQRMKEWAKGHIFEIIIGGAILYTATQWAKDFALAFKF